MRLFLLVLLALSPLRLLAEDQLIQVATFDSGFGGFFTAKEIEREARGLAQTHQARFKLTHYGDTANAPYGEKTPAEIARFAAKGISRAFADGAEDVFIACNTASTQYEAIKKILNEEKPGLGDRTISIIESSVSELKRQIEERFQRKKTVRVGVLATPATVRAMSYPRALARAFDLPYVEAKPLNHTQDRWYTKKGKTLESAVSTHTLRFPDGRTVELYQIGPGNWVDMIEHAAPVELQKASVRNDLKFLAPKVEFDVVGEFCTHFPVFDEYIKATSLELKLATPQTTYIKQGPLMAGIFKDLITQRLAAKKRTVALGPEEKQKLEEALRPAIFISGKNVEETKSLSRKVFPGDPVPAVTEKKF